MTAAATTDERSAQLRAFLEDVRLMRLHRSGDQRAREALIRRYLPLARALAWRYRHGPEPVDDLTQVAAVGLLKAVDRWDPDRGFAFSTFAVPTIRGELRRHFRDATWAVRPPRGLSELSMSVERAREREIAAVGREPTAAELAQRVGRSVPEVEDALQAAAGRVASSLDSPVQADGPDVPTVGEVIGHEDRGFDQAEARATIERVMSILDDRAREILRLRFEHDLAQADIGARVGCSQMHVSRLLRSALDQLSVQVSVGRGG
jgi:RNA polymerase sigma-B factor